MSYSICPPSAEITAFKRVRKLVTASRILLRDFSPFLLKGICQTCKIWIQFRSGENEGLSFLFQNLAAAAIGIKTLSM